MTDLSPSSTAIPELWQFLVQPSSDAWGGGNSGRPAGWWMQPCVDGLTSVWLLSGPLSPSVCPPDTISSVVSPSSSATKQIRWKITLCFIVIDRFCLEKWHLSLHLYADDRVDLSSCLLQGPVGSQSSLDLHSSQMMEDCRCKTKPLLSLCTP